MGEGYAVVDTETTGISVGYRHRIAEVAVVQVGFDGVITDEWSTLINPERDLGPQAVHGIRAGDARRAPLFGDAAGALVDRLRGRILVSHNWPFDAMHLRAEFERLAVATPLEANTGICTMQAAGRALPGSRRSLIECCAAAGIADDHRWHTALEDARATAELLRFFLRRAPTVVSPTAEQRRLSDWQWPVLPAMTRPVMLRRAPDTARPHFLARLVDRIPRLGDPVPDAYLAVLDGALLDRQISETEGDALVDVAHDLGLHRTEVTTIHECYLRELASAAWADGVVTAEEQRDLEVVAVLLDLDRALVERLLREPPARDHPLAHFTPAGLQLRDGDRIVLTGEMIRGRAEITAEAESAGLRPTTAVSRKTRVVVAADADSMSGKAKAARAIGVPVVSEECFYAALAQLGGSADRP